LFGVFDRIRKYPITLIIKQKGLGIRTDRASRIKEKGGTECHLIKGTGEKIRPIPMSCMERGEKGKIYAFLDSPEKGVYYAAKWNNPDGIKVQSKEMDTWRILQHAKSRLMFPRKQSWLEKYLPLVMVMTICGTLVLIALFTWRESSSIAGSLAGMAETNRQTAQIIADAISRTPPLS